MVLGAILGAVSLGAAALGGGNKVKQTSQSGFATLPAEVQQAYLKTYLPAVLQNFNAPRPQIPLSRAEAPTDIFGSQELYKYQKFKDAQRLRGTINAQSQPVQPAQQSRAGLNEQDFNALISSIMPQFGIPEGVNRSKPYEVKQIDQTRALQDAFKRFLGGQ